jgi:hypothetical protein
MRFLGIKFSVFIVSVTKLDEHVLNPTNLKVDSWSHVGGIEI